MRRTGRRRAAVVAAVLSVVSLAAACTAANGAENRSVALPPPLTSVPAVTATTDAPETSATQVTVPAQPGTTTSTTTSRTSTSTPPPPKPPATVAVTPADQATGISPVDPISVKVSGGTLTEVSLVNAVTGVVVEGSLAADGSSWTVPEPVLGYGKTYLVTAHAKNPEGKVSVTESTFTTLTPDNQTAVAYSFPANGMTVGVGQPIAITFDERIGNREAAEQAVTITTTPAQEGAFRWISDKEVRWRPKDYWQPGTAVTVEVDIYGKDLGNSLFGQKDKEFSFTIGDKVIGVVDDTDKILRVSVNDQVVREIPVSMGSNKYPTMNGVYVVAEGYDKKVMDSSTWGLTGAGAYRTEVQYAVRMSGSGIFTHGAPWSEWAQGSQNVSHGCLNMTIEHARWVYENMHFGDIIVVQNTVGDPLPVWDGFGDWNMSWDAYRA